MSTRPSSRAEPRIAASPAIALAATVGLGRSGQTVDELDGPGALGRWLVDRRADLGDEGPDTALRVAEFRSLRDAVDELLAAVVDGRPLPLAAVAGVNETAASAPLSIRLDVSDPGRPAVREAVAAGSRTAAILAAIARSVIELVGGPDRERLHRCDAPRCGRFFLGERRGVRWCSAACGNRARVARHHARRRASTLGQRPTL